MGQRRVHVGCQSRIEAALTEKAEDHFKIGETYPMKIIKINEGEKKIGLSIKAVKQDEYQKDLDSYRESTAAPTSTALGDAFRAAQAAREREKE